MASCRSNERCLVFRGVMAHQCVFPGALFVAAGDIPQELGILSVLRHLRLEGNRFGGESSEEAERKDGLRRSETTSWVNFIGGDCPRLVLARG